VVREGADPGLGGGKSLEQGGFAGIGAPSVHVRQDLELPGECGRFRPGSPGWAEAGERIREEVKWALPMPPLPPWQDQAIPGGHEVFKEPALSASKTRVPEGTRHDHRGAVFAVPVLAHAAAAVFRLEDAAALKA